MRLKSWLKKIIPASWLLFYHKGLALGAAFFYRFPSEKLIVIGVTGTNGKSTVVNFIARLLEGDGVKTGLTSTVNFKIGEKEWLNDKKMTMLGRFQLQKMLRQMVRAGCRYAVIETSSQGIEQFRHLGINYDVAVFTNLTPEHIEAHGGFENYKKAKGKLFAYLAQKPRKIINGKKIPKIIIANKDDEQADYFLSFPADEKITYSLNQPSDYQATEVHTAIDKMIFKVCDKRFEARLIGRFNVYNLLAAIAVARKMGLSFDEIRKRAANLSGVPGRMELINEGQDFTVLVDYAPEPVAMKNLYETIGLFEKNKIIHVLGSCGGGRDAARRPILGQLTGEKADYVIVTNEDPYDDDPMEIINQVAAGAMAAGKILGENLFKILDREEAIKKAITLAEADDLVLITGKGSEQAMAVANGKYLPWDDLAVVRKILKLNLNYK